MTGCQAFHLYRPMPVLALDADTKQPIPGVAVNVSYPLAQQYFAPWESAGTTGQDGVARLRAAPYGDGGILVDVAAKGYMNEQKFLTKDEVQAVAPAYLFEDVQRRTPQLVVELIAAPRPTVEIVVPPGFAGMVKAKIQIQENAPRAPGQRNFTYDLPPSGEILITGPPLFRHVVLTDLRFKDGSARPLSLHAKETAFGYWFVKQEENYYYFLIGSQSEFDDLRRAQLERHINKNTGPGSRPGLPTPRKRGGNGQPAADSSNDASLPPIFQRSTGDPPPAELQR
jgi:hypothetical protein